MSKRNRYIKVNDGDTLVCDSGQEFHLTCCDCYLTHKIAVSVVGKEVRLTMTRDDRRTGQKRRRKREFLVE
ncbi:hypothetical protein LCGC14_1049750 [marine sediment metagenome]|uniref:Uncharacterized protein n=1 Tax=marine sediment metagenome TaxID=412755 RepID=A0A0F9Q786_9ZZZZ